MSDQLVKTEDGRGIVEHYRAVLLTKDRQIRSLREECDGWKRKLAETMDALEHARREVRVLQALAIIDVAVSGSLQGRER